MYRRIHWFTKKIHWFKPAKPAKIYTLLRTVRSAVLGAPDGGLGTGGALAALAPPVCDAIVRTAARGRVRALRVLAPLPATVLPTVSSHSPEPQLRTMQIRTVAPRCLKQYPVFDVIPHRLGITA